MANKRGRPPYADVLTPGEWRVVEAVRHGLSNPEIAQRQDVSIDAVKYHVTNALQKLGLTSRAELRRWDGIAAASRAHEKAKDPRAAPLTGRIGQIARTVENLDDARSWYRDVLGLDELYAFSDMAFFQCEGVRLLLSQGESSTESIVYFSVQDVHRSYETLKARGVAFMNAPHMIHRHDDGTEEWMAFFHDNEERPLAIMAKLEPGD